MTWYLTGSTVRPGDLALLVGQSHKRFLIRIVPGEEFQTHRGVLQHDDLIGKDWGTLVRSHKGNPFYLLQPSLADVIQLIKRNTQILYPKDIGYILVTMGIGPGMRVLEAGTGSGGLTTAMAFAVGSIGKVFSYDVREEMQKLAQKNLNRIGLEDRVVFKLRDIREGFDERDIDAIFLDLPNPWDYITQVKEALKKGGYFGCILPTTNQVTQLLYSLRINQFAFIDVLEVMLRYYQAEESKFRPVDRMVAHTGYLIFARPIHAEEGGDDSFKVMGEDLDSEANEESFV